MSKKKVKNVCNNVFLQAVEATCWTRWGNEHKYQKAWSQVRNLYSICDDGDDDDGNVVVMMMTM